jgi:tRNA pseudouridine32 synthase/23S rRNA pseudouridine746 synthase
VSDLDLVTYFDPQPAPATWPARLPSPFAEGPPHPLAARAAAAVMAELRVAPPVPVEAFTPNQRGKMFGVLVVAGPDGRVGYLRAFSGMLAGRWQLHGFVGPMFDEQRRAATWPAGEAELIAFDQRLHELEFGPAAEAARAALTEVETRHKAEAEAMAAAHATRRAARHTRRAELDHAEPGELAGTAAESPDSPERRALRHALQVESRADAAAYRARRTRHREERTQAVAAIRALDAERAALKQRQAARSCELLEELFAGYLLPNARGETQPLRALFAPATPPGGAGDCAAPKLLGHALRAGLRPLALAEFWWGPPPATGGRHEGRYYPACRGKCGPVLAHMMEGLAVDPTPVYAGRKVAAHEPATVYEDRWLVVVEKPSGLLSVPGRGHALRDSVLVRLAARYPEAKGPLLVHRLDLDTSGLLLAAKDEATHEALQRLFSRREIEKRYIAWLSGAVAGERGRIELALRVDVDDRPRHVFDPLHGRPAVTDWEVLARDPGSNRTRVAFYPRTGRTHQLRVHAAHPRGLAAPIVGDRLYGAADDSAPRLLLHAEALAFVHPHTGERVSLERPAPF